jgi:hypothetical protein
MGEPEIVVPDASGKADWSGMACGSCRTCGRRKRTPSHEVLARREQRAAHRLHEAQQLGVLTEEDG